MGAVFGAIRRSSRIKNKDGIPLNAVPEKTNPANAPQAQQENDPIKMEKDKMKTLGSVTKSSLLGG
jgi:hypothetical protein